MCNTIIFYFFLFRSFCIIGLLNCFSSDCLGVFELTQDEKSDEKLQMQGRKNIALSAEALAKSLDVQINNGQKTLELLIQARKSLLQIPNELQQFEQSKLSDVY
mgnify:CR=1 FL=1